MNPYMMQYWNDALQRQQQMPRSQQPFGLGVGLPGLQLPPPMQEQMMQQQQAQAEMEQEEAENPINKGIARGIEAARQSMKASDEQKRSSAGIGALKFAQHFDRGRHGEGFAGTLGAINEALNPAIQAYIADQREQEALNHQLMKEQELLARQDRQDELAERRLAQQDALRRDQMAATAAYRNAMLGLAQQKIDSKKENEPAEYSKEGFDLTKYSPIENKQMLNLYNKDKQGTAKVLSQLNEIEKMDKEYQKLTKGSLIDPSNPYIGGIANKLKDVTGYMGAKNLRKETVKRQQLNSKLESFTINAERAMKGGVLGPGIIDRFKKMGIFPTLEEPADIRNAKIKDLKKELKNLHDAADSSIKYKRQIDPLDYEEMQSLFKGNDDLSELSDEELFRLEQEALNE